MTPSAKQRCNHNSDANSAVRPKTRGHVIDYGCIGNILPFAGSASTRSVPHVVPHMKDNEDSEATTPTSLAKFLTNNGSAMLKFARRR